MVILVPLLTALGGHTSVAHDHRRLAGNPQLHPVGRERTLVDGEPPRPVVGDPVASVPRTWQ